ncbi:MAG: hypothetical protein HY906_18280, partial [Deltaproteobacteria bacterium]|nr:hypothetical protein [Deltaproteobacteria bacterium]
MGHLYGDSTMFPFAPDFIEIVRHAVDAGVQLMAAQHAMGKARRRTDSVEQQRQGIRAQLATLGDALSATLEPFLLGKSERAARVCKLIRERSKELIAAEEESLEGAVTEKMSSSRTAIESARQSSFRAIETFVLRHDLPETDVGLHLVAEESRYRGQALVTTPFGAEAVFDLAIPTAHDWGQPRRVVELSAGTEVHVPMESGIFTKKIEPRPVKLDRLFIAEVAISSTRTLITLRKGPRSGAGYQIEVLDEEVPRAILSHVTEEGATGPEEPLTLGDQDSVHVLRLWNRVLDTSRDLPMRRQAMTEATFEGKSIMELDEPRRVCERLVEVLAPVVQQLGRKSGAPGELVIRRDVGEGRREEVFITKAELQEKVLALPEDLQVVFAP